MGAEKKEDLLGPNDNYIPETSEDMVTVGFRMRSLTHLSLKTIEDDYSRT